MIKRLVALALIPAMVLAAPNDIRIQQMNTGGTAYVDRLFAPASGTSFTTAAGFRTAIGAGTGNGDVTGPSSATDNAIVRFDLTTGKIIQNSAVTVADTTGAMTWAASQNATLTAGSSGSSLTLQQSSSGFNVGSRALVLSATDPSSLVDSTFNPGIKISNDANNAIVQLDSYGTAVNGIIRGRRARGTFSSPTAIQADDEILGMTGRAYGSTGFSASSRAVVSFRAGQNWTDANQGTYINFGTTPNNSTTQASSARLTQNLLIGTTTDMSGTGGLSVAGTTASTNTTSGAVIVAGGVGIGGALFGTTSSFSGNVTLSSSSGELRMGGNTRLLSGSQGTVTLLSQAGGGDTVYEVNSFVTDGNAVTRYNQSFATNVIQAGVAGPTASVTETRGKYFVRDVTNSKTMLYGDSANGWTLLANNSAAVTIGTTTTTFAGAIVESVDSLSGAGAVSVTATATKLTTTGGNALTLADGVNGQTKHITMISDGGDGTLTPTTKTGFSTIVFDAVGDSVTLKFYTTQGWMVLSNYNCTVNP